MDFETGVEFEKVDCHSETRVRDNHLLLLRNITMSDNLWLAQIGSLSPPRLSHSVHREECTQCFDNQVLLLDRVPFVIDGLTNPSTGL